MSYEEATLPDTTITQAQALRELKLHSANVQEFFAEVGEKAEYSGKEVLNWLGY